MYSKSGMASSTGEPQLIQYFKMVAISQNTVHVIKEGFHIFSHIAISCCGQVDTCSITDAICS